MCILVSVACEPSTLNQDKRYSRVAANSEQFANFLSPALLSGPNILTTVSACVSARPTHAWPSLTNASNIALITLLSVLSLRSSALDLSQRGLERTQMPQAHLRVLHPQGAVQRLQLTHRSLNHLQIAES